jgi:phosphate transport system permease protein
MSLKSSASPNYSRRKAIDVMMRSLVFVATGLAIVPLVLIIGYVIVIGGGALNWEFFTDIYQPPMQVSMPDLGPIDPNDPFANLDLGSLVGGEPGTGQEGANDEKGADILEAPARGGVTGLSVRCSLRQWR